MIRPAPVALGLLLIVCSAVLLVGCGEGPEDADRPVSGPRVLVLGTAQDGGLPHVACRCDRCEAARRDPASRRRVSSLLLETVDPPRRYLIDATPDLPEQLASLTARIEEARVDRRPLDGIFLTHAHIGHYLGLAYLGFEAMHAPGIPVHCTPRFASFLESNGPWEQLVRLENIRLMPMDDERVLEGGLRIRAIPAPHRDEYTDTVAFLIEGPTSRVLFAPDTDDWVNWEPPIESWLADVDVAILDGTFYSYDELPGRDVGSVGHPLISESIDRFSAMKGQRGEIYFTHFNHSNPVLQNGPALERLRKAGFHRLEDGSQFPL
ncbi:MAG: MBL fold metallo-hydrolase [Acidobacteriota bacterium]|nr:MBL fold metallo-hydrolase [Acidobacteriota bacterium]MDH3786699.1 MBL fold metallo-hydrolase [Acidobacteriota bacterium]